MIILGLILIVLALAGAVFLFAGTSALDPIQLEVLNQTYSMSPLALVIAGAVAMTLLWWGWALVRIGTRRRVRKSREAKEAARQAELDRAAREKENQAKWERELRERERQVRETEARLAEQRISTSEARKRAEVAENKVDDGQSTRNASTQPVRSGPPDTATRPADGTEPPQR
jgi:type VI protein secretion system component VasK